MGKSKVAPATADASSNATVLLEFVPAAVASDPHCELNFPTRIVELSLGPPISGGNVSSRAEKSRCSRWAVLGSLPSPALHPLYPLMLFRGSLLSPAWRPLWGLLVKVSQGLVG